MCNRHSFILTRAGKVLDGWGITDSQTTIRELHGLKNTDDSVNAYEWQPPKGWPDADWHLGLTKDSEVFQTKSSHEEAMERHIRALYPSMDAWNEGDPIRIPQDLTRLRASICVPAGVSMTLPALTEVSGDVLADQGATLTAPLLKKGK